VPDGNALNTALTLLPPLGKGRETKDRRPPRHPKLGDGLDIVLVLKDGGVQLPEPRTRGYNVRD